MDIYPNVSVSGGIPAGVAPAPVSSPSRSMLEEFFPGENMESQDVSLEWLSIFVEDCLSGTTSYTTHLQGPPPPSKPQSSQNSQGPLRDDQASAPANARTKRRRTTSKRTQLHELQNQTHSFTHPDPPLLQPADWLAESELLIIPKREEENKPPPSPVAEVVGPKRCTHCLSQKTPQWREGPMGPKTLCNACGVRFKSGRLHPEYRPAKSPTFVSYMHSNSHKKVMQMRKAMPSSNSN